MNRVLGRVDAWCRRGDFTVEDVARFRIIYGVVAFLTVQQIGWVASIPADQFDPPPGPMMILRGVPPQAVLEGLEVVTLVLAALLVLGLHTRTVSILLGGALMAGLGVVYSLGKIDHTIVVVLVPLVMAFSGWGNALSVDAARSDAARSVAQWPLRLLALMIGLSFVSAGFAKVRTGWLDLDTHAVQAHLTRRFYGQDRTDWLASQAVELRLGGLWEVLDWFTVALELGLVLTVISWRAFRLAIAVASVFHLGVLLIMNIVFSWNMLGYAAFVRWNSLAPTDGSPPHLSRAAGYASAVALGVLGYALHDVVGPDLQTYVRTVVVFIGAAAAAGYLAVKATSGSRRRPA